MDDEWDLHAVVRSCATSTESSVAVGDKTPVATDANDRAPEKRLNESKLISISFDDGRSANDEQSVFSNFISFSMTPDADVNHARKRKSKNMKRVVVMREEEVSNDGWAWRKYGQKPIKNSPYPRNYYRCSTRKDCMARKRVERSLVDASSFIVTYYDNHKHPQPSHHISLAGTTRINKLSNMVATDLPEQSPCSSSSPASTSSFSPATSLKEDETEMND